MSKTRLDDRIDNAIEAFFDLEPDYGNFGMTYTGPATLGLDGQTGAETVSRWVGIGREVLLFGPGTFALFYMTLAEAFFYPSVGSSLYWYFAAIFLTYAGAGSITKVRNLLIPASTIVLALLIVLLSIILLGRETANHYFWESIYLFPGVLVFSKLIQSWISNK